jgi:23S rRNA pseudouridine1911/1915/1917 synthase
MSTLHLIADHDHERVDVFLARTLPSFSRSYWQKLCEQGSVLHESDKLRASTPLKVGDTLTVVVPEQPDFSQESLPVIYEDDAVIVVNKPAGILTHAKGVISDEFTVAEFIRPRTTDGLGTNRPGIVHRLDRGTSGLLITARTPEAKRWLQKQFSERRVKKTYTALVHGHLAEPKATLDLPLERNPAKPQTFRVSMHGKPAQTSYTVSTVFRSYELVELRPLTGRTHQLRVHMAYLHHPIVGDTLYGSTETRLGRTFLHAGELELTLPGGIRKVFTAPLPPALQAYLDILEEA